MLLEIVLSLTLKVDMTVIVMDAIDIIGMGRLIVFNDRGEYEYL